MFARNQCAAVAVREEWDAMCKARGSDGYRCFVINKCRSISGKTKNGVAYSSANTKAVQEAPASMDVDSDCAIVETPSSALTPNLVNSQDKRASKEKEVILLDSDGSDDDDAPLLPMARK